MPRVHINLPVRDLETSIDFYSKVFHTEPSKRRADYANFRLEIPALHLALVHHPDLTEKQDFGQHFGVELFDDTELPIWKERLKQAGILPYLEEEAVTCCYAVADKFWLQDPDGNQWEFWVRHNDNGETLFSSKQENTCCAPTEPEETACWGPTPTKTGCC